MHFVGQHLFWSMVWVFLIAGIPLIIAAIIGLGIAIVQAATQVQDQTLPQTVKILSIGLVLLVFGGILSMPLVEQAKAIFNDIPKFAG